MDVLERKRREQVLKHVNDLGIFGNVKSKYPITYYSDVDVERWDPVKVISVEAATGIPISVSRFGRYTNILRKLGIITFGKLPLKILPKNMRAKIIGKLLKIALRKRYRVLKELAKKYHRVDDLYIEKLLKLVEKYAF